MQKNNATINDFNIKHGLKDGLPIGLGYLSVSFAFGVQASILGVPAFMSLFISMTNLTSAGQLAGLTIIASIGTILEMILTQLVINARYFLMGVSLSQKLDKNFSIADRFFFSAFITDEIFAVASLKPSAINKKYFLGLVILPYVGWSLGTILGAVLGDVLPTQITNALGIALYAMFIAIIVPPSIKNKGVLVAILLSAGLSSAMFYLPFLPKISSGLAVIISAIITSMIVAFFFPINKEKQHV
jgi:predicted branched-subunit amino acid permease